MNLVLYNIDDKYFNFPGNSFGAFIQDSPGLFDELEPKPRFQYDWPEQHGIQISTKRSNLYLPREIILKGWIEGSDWLDVRDKFNALFSSFRKSNKVRMTITPFGQKSLIYDVLTTEEISFDKKFKSGEMIGFFNIKLTEHNPIKKIFKSNKSLLLLKGIASTPIELIIGNTGISTLLNGSFNISKSLVTGPYNIGFPGENMVRNSTFYKGQTEWGVGGLNISFDEVNGEALLKLNSTSDGLYQTSIPVRSGKKYTVSFETKSSYQDNYSVYMGFSNNAFPVEIPISGSTWIKSTHVIESYSEGDNFIMYGLENGRNEFYLRNLKIEEGTIYTGYTQSPYDETYISFAGKLEDLTLTEINSILTWDRL